MVSLGTRLRWTIIRAKPFKPSSFIDRGGARAPSAPPPPPLDPPLTIWLGYEMKDRDHVACLKCTVCSMFRERLFGMRNFSNAFIEGSINLRSSNYQDHSKSAMYEKAMTLFKLKKSGTDKPTCSTIQNTPIVRALQTLDQKTCDQMMKKFDIAYFMAKENLALNKFDAIRKLEEKHNVYLGQVYNNRLAYTEFVKYIADDFKNKLSEQLSKAKFYSVQFDGYRLC